MSTPKQALTDLEKGKPWPIYYLYGDEPFKIHEFVDKLAQTIFGQPVTGASTQELSFRVERLDGAVSSGADVLEAVQTLGLFAPNGAGDERPHRLVIVRDAGKLKETAPLFEALLASGKGSSPWADSLLVLLAETIDARRKLHQWLKKSGYALEFKPARDAELAQWVHYLAKKAGATVTPDAVPLLSVLSDGSLYRLAQEIQKAWLYAGAKEGLVLTTEHVAAVSSSQVTHEMIELVRAVLEGKRARSLLLSERLIKAPEDALGLVGFLTWAIKSPGRGYAGTIVGGQGRVRRLVQSLVDLDQRLKTSGLDPNALVEKFIIEETTNG